MTDRKIRIAYLITDLDVGGAERNLTALAAGLDRRRFEVSVTSLLPAGRAADELRRADVPVSDLHMTGWTDLRVFPRLVGWLRRVRPHILHTWLFHANVLGRCAAPVAGRPRVVSSIRVAEPRRSHLALERLTAPLADLILVNSPGLRDYVVEKGIDLRRVKVIPNAVDLARFGPRKSPAELTSRTVLFVGRLDRQKGVDVLLRAAAKFLQRPGLRFLVVGDGPDWSMLRSLAESLGLSNVEFAGRSDHVPELLAEAEVLVLPSRWEGLPNVVLEAMGARCPVVATDVTGSRDLIEDGRNGLLVPPEDPDLLAAALERVLADASLARSLAERGFDTARTYTLARMVEAHEEVYLRLLGRR